MSKLQILIPQYNETEEIIKPLLDSIAIQQSISLKEDIEVFIGNDGSDTKLSIDFLKQFPFRIQYHYFEHGGLAATRQKLQDLATADYIMFCDADDQFISTIALSLIMSQMNKPFDVLVCDFLEEHKQPQTYIFHHDDPVFVHGKVYRHQFLLDNRIEWNPNLREHQDSAFNILARTLAKTQRICQVPIYMWCDNPNSISRKDQQYHSVKTWCAMLDSYDSLIEDFTKRGYGYHARYYAVWALYATYYEMSHKVWQENFIEEKLNTYKRIVEFYNKYELLIMNLEEDKEQEVIKRTQEIAKKYGPLVNDMPPFEEWLGAILKIF